jgi:transcriptional regulator of heat shock response
MQNNTINHDAIWNISEAIAFETGRLQAFVAALEYASSDKEFAKVQCFLTEEAISKSISEIDKKNDATFRILKAIRGNASQSNDSMLIALVQEQLEAHEKIDAGMKAGLDETQLQDSLDDLDLEALPLAEIRADTVKGIAAKARWLSISSNFNDGSFDDGALASRVLTSLLSDLNEIGSVD